MTDARYPVAAGFLTLLDSALLVSTKEKGSPRPRASTSR